MQQHELVCKQDFVLVQMSDLDALENYLRIQLFCHQNVPCSVLLTESYKQFRTACCRKIRNAALGSSHEDPLSDPSTHNFPVVETQHVFLDNSWKLELSGNRVSVLKLESKTFDPLLPDGANYNKSILGCLGSKRSVDGEVKNQKNVQWNDMV